MKTVLCLLSSVLCLSFTSCATAPRTYQPPSPAKINASTARVAHAVDAAHASARSAQAKVNDARKRAKLAREEAAKVKDLPPIVTKAINDLGAELEDATKLQMELEIHLKEADTAKAQVEKDKADYFAQAQKLADAASDERTKRIADEKKLSWYRWHWYGSWIALGLGVVACLVFAFLKFTGRLAIVGAKIGL